MRRVDVDASGFEVIIRIVHEEVALGEVCDADDLARRSTVCERNHTWFLLAIVVTEHSVRFSWVEPAR